MGNFFEAKVNKLTGQGPMASCLFLIRDVFQKKMGLVTFDCRMCGEVMGSVLQQNLKHPGFTK